MPTKTAKGVSALVQDRFITQPVDIVPSDGSTGTFKRFKVDRRPNVTDDLKKLLRGKKDA